MASRYAPTPTHPQQPNQTRRFNQRDGNRSSLFSGYDQQTRSRPSSVSPAPPRSYNSPSNSSYGYNADAGGPSNNAFSAYPSSNGGFGGSGTGLGDGFRSATPNPKGQYSDAVLSELESQNDEQVSVLSGKVAMLKDVSLTSLLRSVVFFVPRTGGKQIGEDAKRTGSCWELGFKDWQAMRHGQVEDTKPG